MTVYDKVLPNSAFSSLIALTIGMLVVIVFDFIMKMLRAYFIDVAGQKLDDEVAEKVYDKITSHDISVLGASNGNTGIQFVNLNPLWIFSLHRLWSFLLMFHS